MNIPTSPHFTPVDLGAIFNAARTQLPDPLRPPRPFADLYGATALLGIPFHFGRETQAAEGQAADVLHLAGSAATIPLAESRATYLLFAHVVADRVSVYRPGLADHAVDGNILGDRVATYTLLYADGSRHETPILRRFAIQQARIGWGASPFAAMPATRPRITFTASEEIEAHGCTTLGYGQSETRHRSGRDGTPEHLWLYALPNPHPEKAIAAVLCTPGDEEVAIYGVSSTQLAQHPLRPATRRKLRLRLPEGAQLNRLGDLEEIDVDLGSVISARAILAYDRTRWLGDEPQVQPERSATEVLVELAAHPQARLYVGAGGDEPVCFDLADMDSTISQVAAAERPVRIRVVEAESGRPVPVRLHLHGEHGEYLPPRGHHRKVNPYWFEDNYAELVVDHNRYAYIDGACVADLPLGTVFVEITRGYEVQPVRTQVEVTAETEELTFTLERVLHWRERGWVTADTHVHFLSPQTALLEGQAEGVNVVNLLASQWGEMYSNVGDFDGRTILGAQEFGGDGEFLVRVGTENRMQVLGHISLLGYGGPMIHPLCTGGPSESAVGDPLEVSMAEWAQRCIDQGGLVVMPHGPDPQLERAADLVLGVVHAIEMMTFNPLTPDTRQLNPYGIADWYRYLNLGYRVPLVGGSDKMAAASLLGGMRTYAHLGDRPFTYADWMEAVRAGNTFATVGPLAELTVDGVAPGGAIRLPASGGTVDVSWRVESVSLPVDAVDLVMGGVTAEAVQVGKRLAAQGTVRLRVTDSTWVALRVRGSYHGRHGEIAAHTSAVQLLVGDRPIFAKADAMTVLEQIEGAIAYVDTLAPRPEAQRYKAIRAGLEAAHSRLHQRMHQMGVYHEHTLLHDHSRHHEH